MTDEEAKQEHDDIQAELAKKHGVEAKPEEKPEDEDVEKEEAVEEEHETKDEPDEPEKEDEDEPKAKKDKEDKDLVDPEDPKSSRYMPISKYQDLKREDREIIAAKDKKIQELSDELNKAKTVSAIGDKVKTFAEKHGVTEEMAIDLVTLVKGENALDPKTQEILQKTEARFKKEELTEAFENEFADLVKETPEAASLKETLKAKAYEKDNLNRSLYEIFHRQLKTAPEKKKTAESTRASSGRENGKSLDFNKIAEDIKNNVSGALGKLSGEDQDRFFDWAEQNSSRYQFKK